MCRHLGFRTQWVHGMHITRILEATHALKGVVDRFAVHVRNKWSWVVAKHVGSYVGPLGLDAGACV